MNSMMAIMPRGNYKHAAYPVYKYKLRNRNALINPQNRYIMLDGIGNGIRFINPLRISYTIEDGYFIAEYDIEGFVIASAGDTISEVVKDLKDQLHHAWDYYALEQDSNLTDGAKAVKDWMLKHLEA